jgi:hypothetical protein
MLVSDVAVAPGSYRLSLHYRLTPLPSYLLDRSPLTFSALPNQTLVLICAGAGIPAQLTGIHSGPAAGLPEL